MMGAVTGGKRRAELGLLAAGVARRARGRRGRGPPLPLGAPGRRRLRPGADRHARAPADQRARLPRPRARASRSRPACAGWSASATRSPGASASSSTTPGRSASSARCRARAASAGRRSTSREPGHERGTGGEPKLESEGFGYGPDVVVLGYVLNDSEDEDAAEARRAVDWAGGAARGGVRAPSRCSTARPSLRLVRGARRGDGREPPPDRRLPLDVRRRLQGLGGGQGGAAGDGRPVPRARRAARGRDLPAVRRTRSTQSYPFADVHAKVAQAAAEAGARVLDLLPRYRGLDWRLLVVDGADDEHPNEIAHRIAAQAIAREVDEVLAARRVAGAAAAAVSDARRARRSRRRGGAPGRAVVHAMRGQLGHLRRGRAPAGRLHAPRARRPPPEPRAAAAREAARGRAAPRGPRPRCGPTTVSWAEARQWEFGRRFLYRWNDGDRLLFLGRLPIVALASCLVAAVFFETRRRFGPRRRCRRRVPRRALARGPRPRLARHHRPRLRALLLPLRRGVRPRARASVGRAAGSRPASRRAPRSPRSSRRRSCSACSLRSAPGRRSAGRRAPAWRRVGLGLLAVGAVTVLLVVWASLRLLAGADARSRRCAPSCAERARRVGRGAGRRAPRSPRRGRSSCRRTTRAGRVRDDALGGAPDVPAGRAVATRGFPAYFLFTTFLLKTPVPLLLLAALALGARARGCRGATPRSSGCRSPSTSLSTVHARAADRPPPPAADLSLPVRGRRRGGGGASRVASPDGRVARGRARPLVRGRHAAEAPAPPRVLQRDRGRPGATDGGCLVDSNLDWGQDLKRLAEWATRAGTSGR